MADGRADPSRRGGGPAVSASGETLFEFVTCGNATRCAAIDAATGVEVVVIGPANAAEAHLRMLALRKLKLRLERG